jgi:hypothetical protein
MAIDFLKRLKGPVTPDKVHMTLRGFVTDRFTGITTEGDLEWKLIQNGEGSWSFKIIGGPTGYECVEIKGDFKKIY